ncbi:MAG: Nudix family hydrolase [Thiocapsa sp.]|nr:Nudix family hydrolase [Thiocapsa sp.]MCG6986535.1 Nudix family hydrolase [Thiocapsa sp.]
MSESTPNTAAEPKAIHVMVGALSDAAGRVLVTKRADHLHQGGLWEFPGGKLERGESPERGLARELAEELGIRVRASRPLIRVRHDYADRRVLLDVRRVHGYDGVPVGQEGQPLAWLRPESMDPDCFPAADRPIIAALRIPDLFLITGRDPVQPAVFLKRLERALESGLSLIQLRAHALPAPDYRDLAQRAFSLCERAGARLLLNRDPAQTIGLPRHGLHLTTRTLMRLTERPGRPDDLVGASCHNAAELAQAARLGLDYGVVSPIRRTASHPGAEPLGWRGLAELSEAAVLPVYALGGLTTADLEVAIAHGAQGVAAIRGLWPEI